MASPFGSPGPVGFPVGPARGAGVSGAATEYSPGRVQLHPVGGKKPSLFCPVLKLPHGSLFAIFEDVSSLSRLLVRRRLRCAVLVSPCGALPRWTSAWRYVTLGLGYFD